MLLLNGIISIKTLGIVKVIPWSAPGSLNLQIYSNASRMSTTDAPSWARWKQLTHQYLKRFCKFWETHFFFANSSWSDKISTHILNADIDYIQLTKRFDELLFWIMRFFSFFIYVLDKFTSLYGCKFQHNFFRLPLSFI